MNDRLVPLPISVIIPAYQAEETIVRAVESVRAQSRAPREIIVVDDGSRDATAALAARAGARVIRQQNAGCSAARNRAVLAASSPWIACLDADDEWVPTKLERIWNAHRTAPQVELWGHDFLPIRGHAPLGRSGLRAKPSYWRAARRRIGPSVSVFDEANVARALPLAHFVAPSTILATRELLVAIPFDERLPRERIFHIGEDQEWLLRAVKRTPLAMLEETLTIYHLQPGSLTSHVGRMKYGDVRFSYIVEAMPERYAAGAAASLARVRPRRYREAVLEFMRALDFANAHTIGRAWLAEGRRVDAVLLVACAVVGGSSLGTAAARVARIAWRRAVAPLVRALLRT